MLKNGCVLSSLIVLYIVPCAVFAEAAQKNPISPDAIIASESMTKMITGLLVVLVLIIGLTWLLKRFSIIPTATAGHIKIVAATGVGQRERVVIVEIGETWLVLGVAPGQVNKLHSLERSTVDAANNTLKNTIPSFSEKLDNSINKSSKQ